MKPFTDIPCCTNCGTTFNTIFKELNPEQIDLLNYEKGCTLHKRGTVLYQEGSRVAGVYCVNNGILKLFKTGLDGKEQILRFAKKGDLVGYRSVLSEEPACSTAKVIEDAVLCFIPAKMLVQMVKENPEFAMKLMRMSCQELGTANKYILDIAQKTVRERLADILLFLKNDFGLDNDGILQITLTREELANIVGTATESVIRLLSEFKSDKLIELNGRKIKIVNEKGLERIANFYK